MTAAPRVAVQAAAMRTRKVGARRVADADKDKAVGSAIQKVSEASRRGWQRSDHEGTGWYDDP